MQQTNGYLGVMLDCSRNAVMKVEKVKRLILDLEKMGYNCLQLYTEDTYEIEGEPLFGYMRGRYTKAELKEIDAFAKEHGIELMPCIQTLAHLNQIFQYPVYEPINDTGDILLVGEEKTYELIEKMFQTCAECFESRNINIGMDEAHMLGVGKYLDRNGYQKREEIILRHLKKVCEIAEKYGFKPMMWSDMFFRMAFHGKYYYEGEIPKEVRDKVPENVQLVYWDYYHEDEKAYDYMIREHLDFNRDVWFAGGIWKWIGFHTSHQKTFRTTEPAVKICEKYGVKNFLFTMWGDDGNECPAYACLPSLLYAAECARGNSDIENAKKKFEELFNESWDDFMLLDLPMPDGIPKEFVMQNGAKEMLYNDPFMGKFDYSVFGNGSERKTYADLNKKLSVAKKRSEKFAYIFESFEKLTKVLSRKYDLGYLTRRAYQAGDKKALKALLEDYDAVLDGIEEFTVAFRKMWFADNKPFGFDVQEIRLGGLTARVDSCKERLALYLAGKIDKIEELEEKMGDFDGKGEHKLPFFNNYIGLASANRL